MKLSFSESDGEIGALHGQGQSLRDEYRHEKEDFQAWPVEDDEQRATYYRSYLDL